MNKLCIAHVVRRYGPVGGMERYVWELTRELVKLGVRVVVVCEKCMGEVAPGIELHELGSIRQRPRWLSLIRFSRRVTSFFENHPEPGLIIHSHERLGIHQVTTFHGPPFATVYERGWWKRISLRVRAQLWLERRELTGKQVRAVVPNSPLIGTQLAKYYPGIRLTSPIPPGVAAGPARPARIAPADSGVIGFVGKEYRRKGLEFALQITDLLRESRTKLEFLIAGPEPSEIRSLLAGRNYAKCIGWSADPDLYPKMDLLLHPAKSEPYGMVVAEALAAAVPVVISDRCGIKDCLAPDSGRVLPLEAGAKQWAAACEAELARQSPPRPIERNWNDVALDYLKLYQSFENAQ